MEFARLLVCAYNSNLFLYRSSQTSTVFMTLHCCARIELSQESSQTSLFMSYMSVTSSMLLYVVAHQRSKNACAEDHEQTFNSRITVALLSHFKGFACAHEQKHTLMNSPDCDTVCSCSEKE